MSKAKKTKGNPFPMERCSVCYELNPVKELDYSNVCLKCQKQIYTHEKRT